MTSVAITRIFAASPARVWTAFTDPDALAAWFWPAQLQTKATADVRTGGGYRIESVVGDMAISGHYREVTRPLRLVMTWRWDGEETVSLVTIELTPIESGTELRLRHEQLADDQERDQHEQGWNDCLDRLPSHLDNAADLAR
jgi:uncharacterized protein YndB with AHSA1/START domain